MYFEEVILEYVHGISLALNGDQLWTVLNSLSIVFYICVGNSQLAVHFISESHAVT